MTQYAPRSTNQTAEAEVRAQALAGGMQLMREDGERLVASRHHQPRGRAARNARLTAR